MAKNIFKTGKCMKKSFNVHGYSHRRTATIAATTDKNESPELAAAKPFEEIPSPLMLPIIGSAWIYFPVIGKYSIKKIHVADHQKYKTYGNIVREKFGHLSFVSSFTPDTNEIMYRHEGKYPTRGEITTLKAYRESRKEWYKTNGLMLLQDKEWYDLRSKTQKHLMKPRAVQGFLPSMQDVAKDLIACIEEKMDVNNEVPDILKDLYKWSLEAIAVVGLDTRLGCLKPNLSDESDGAKMIKSVQTQTVCINKLEAFSGNFPFWKYLPSPTYKKLVKEADVFTEIAFKCINRSLEELKNKDDDDSELTLLQSMLMSKGLDVSDAVVTVADMLMAGIDSTSNTVGFFLYHLAKNPDKQEILANEIKQLLPTKEDRITRDVFNRLHYLKACLKESIRLDPVARGNTRTLDHDVVVNGYRIPAGTIIQCILQVIYREEKYFKNANQYWPERWLTKEEKPKNPFAYMPFGIGPRSCIGRRIAELEIICLITEIIRKYKVEYHYGDIGTVTRLAIVPDRPLQFRFLKR